MQLYDGYTAYRVLGLILQEAVPDTNLVAVSGNIGSSRSIERFGFIVTTSGSSRGSILLIQSGDASTNNDVGLACTPLVGPRKRTFPIANYFNLDTSNCKIVCL